MKNIGDALGSNRIDDPLAVARCKGDLMFAFCLATLLRTLNYALYQGYLQVGVARDELFQHHIGSWA